jgi:DNA repair exonuclease SbcCD ATPase subunit
MFAKRAKQPSQEKPTDDGSQTGQSVPDSGSATIERLEREADEQRKLAATLREQLDAATFKIEILEKSYATQLAEVRDKRAAIEAELKEKNEILANLGGGHEHTLRELNDALTVIKVLKAERDKLRKQLAQGGGFRQPAERPTRARQLVDDAGAPPPVFDHSSGFEDTSSGDTINAMIANTSWAEKKASAGSGHAAAQVAQPEAPQEVMLAPDLVFTEKDKDDGN